MGITPDIFHSLELLDWGELLELLVLSTGGGGISLGWSMHMLGWIGYAFLAINVPVRVWYSNMCARNGRVLKYQMCARKGRAFQNLL